MPWSFASRHSHIARVLKTGVSDRSVSCGYLASVPRKNPVSLLDHHRHNAYIHRHCAYEILPKELPVPRRPQTVTDAELAVLRILWQRGPLTAKAITNAIYPDGAESEFASVHSFLQRLERKGLVARDRSAFVHSFSAAVSQADVAGQELETLAARLGEKSIAPLIMQLVAQRRLSEQEVAEIRKLLNKYSK